ncbi:MAG TPA: HAMP domain-containing sensor histidine kinase [Anaeromyxobacter sp.]|nr:HAMP domain-containing sensor histidine kinase [Anaeromyxobacter sp.]
MSRRHRHRHGPLFWRIYLHGLLLLLLVGIAVGAVGFALEHGRGDEAARIAGYAAGRIAELAGTPERLGEELGRLRDDFGVKGTIYDADGRPVATSADPPLERVSGRGAPARGGPVRIRGHGLGFAVPLPAQRGYLLLSGPSRGHDPARGLLFIGAVLVALALGSVPLARSIAAPLETIADAARRLGAGDLAARANLRKARGEVGELGRAFDEMAVRLEALVRGERELLANVSHELRTPLARMRVALELAAEGDRERARRHLAEIGADLSELDALIENVLTAARLDARGAGAWPVARDPVDLAAVVRDAADRFREAHPGRTLEVEVGPAAPGVTGDAALLRRLLAILLDNAAKYSDPPAPVGLALRAAGAGAALEVRDRGIGVDADDLPRLFTPFFRTERSRARGTRGTGLGLVLARRVAEAHGGTIRAESAAGEGTAVRVELPAARAG